MLRIFKRRSSSWDNSIEIYCSCRKRFTALLAFYITILCIFPLISVTLIKSSNFHGTLASIIGRIFFLTTYIVSLVTICIVIANSMKKNGIYTLRNESSTLCTSGYITRLKVEQANVLIAAFTTILGLGNSVFNLAELANHIISIINNEYKSNIELTYLIVSCLESGLRSIFYLFLLIFVIYQKEFKNVLGCITAKCFIGCLAVFCLYQWIFIIFNELHHEKPGQQDKCLNNSDQKLQPLDVVQQFLFPLGIEFRLTLFIELFCMALHANKTTCLADGYAKTGLKKFKSFIFCILNSFCTFFNRFFSYIFWFKIPVTQDPQLQRKHSIVEYFFIFFLIILSLLMASIVFVVILFQDVNMETNTELVNFIRSLCELIIMSIVLSYVVFLFFILHKRSKLQIIQPSSDNNDIEQKVDFFFLFLSNVCQIVFCIFSIAATIKSLTIYEGRYAFVKYIELFRLIFPIIQSPCQLFIVWICEYKITLDNGYIQILALLNFSLWLFSTFNIVMNINNPVMISIYGSIVWEAMVTTLGPLQIFYRFHSCIILIKIKAGKYAFNRENK
jgi:hypothetical protein